MKNIKQRLKMSKNKEDIIVSSSEKEELPQEEVDVEVKAFIEEYTALVKKHGMAIDVSLEYTKRGVFPGLTVTKIQDEQKA